MKLLVMMFPFLITAVSAVAVAEERHLGPHVHGQATVNLSVEGDVLDVEASLPGHDAVGFEHPPGSDSERSALQRATGILNAATWLVPSSGAGCTLSSAKVSPHGFGGASEPGGHADFDAAYRFSCSHIAQLDAVDIALTKAFPSVQGITVNLITAAGSGQQHLDASHTRVELQQ